MAWQHALAEAAACVAHSDSEASVMKLVIPEWLEFDLHSLSTVLVVIWFWLLQLVFLPYLVEFRRPLFHFAGLLHRLLAPCVIFVGA